MLKIIADGKKYQLQDGQIIIVKKINLKTYYLLVMSLLVYKKALSNLGGYDQLKKINEYIDYMRANALDIAKVKVELENIKKILNDCIDIDVYKVSQESVFEIIKNVIEFNTIKTCSFGGKEFEDIDELNEELEVKIGIICNTLNKAPSEALEMENYDISVLIKEYNRNRVNIINDIRVANNADKTQYIKYTKSLMGEIVYTGDEVFKNPELLKGDYH